ncbi:MAG: terminase [Verrucomicrobia bacterium]|nr:terminase [Verrucomicrobiota bacterium]
MTENTPKKREAFLSCLENGDSVQNAANVAGVARGTVYRWRKEDEEFAAAWDMALDSGIDRLEDEAYKRALSGSDTLLIFLLKSKRPSIYSEKQRLEHTSPDGSVGPTRIEIVAGESNSED